MSASPLTRGGLNLEMEQATIKRMAERGQRAIRALVARFESPSGDGVLNGENHRWIRYRSSMAALEETLRSLRLGFLHDFGRAMSYSAMLERDKNLPPTSHFWASDGQRTAAEEATKALVGLDFLERADPVFAGKAPRPLPEYRLMPRE